jgi:hypothetical protein
LEYPDNILIIQLVKIVDKKRMKKRAWGSGICAAILTFFVMYSLGQAVLFPEWSNLFWFFVLFLTMAVEWTSCFFWSQCNLRAPLMSAANQFWVGLLGGGGMIVDAYHPPSLGILANAPAAPLIAEVNFYAFMIGGILTIILQAWVAYGFWKGGPRDYRPFQRGLRKPAPAKDWDA